MKTYTDRELEALLENVESELSERKKAWKGDVPEKSRQAICAFSNDLPDHGVPGVLFIGADEEGEPSGIAVTDELLRTLADVKTDGNILPPPTMTVQKRKLKGADMAVVIVQPSDSPPVRYKGRIWVRTGPRRGLATAQDERILNEKRRFKDAPFEVHPVHQASLKDINRVIFENAYLPSAFAPEVIEDDFRSYEQQLSACGMIVNEEQAVPTVPGILTLGINPRKFIPADYVQFLRIDGSMFSDPITDEELIEGDLNKLVIRADDKLKAHNRVKIDFTSGPLERRLYQYPVPALQQLIRNAVMHRTYESTNAPVRIYWFNDRIEIISPGGPFGTVTTDNFGAPGLVDYRNPRLADAMKVLGFVQRFGIGIQTAQRAMRENGNPEIIFDVDQTMVRCIVKAAFLESASNNASNNAPDSAPDNAPLNQTQLGILRLIKQDEKITYKQLADKLDRDRSTIRRNIAHLKELNYLTREGPVKKGRWIILKREK